MSNSNAPAILKLRLTPTAPVRTRCHLWRSSHSWDPFSHWPICSQSRSSIILIKFPAPAYFLAWYSTMGESCLLSMLLPGKMDWKVLPMSHPIEQWSLAGSAPSIGGTQFLSMRITIVVLLFLLAVSGQEHLKHLTYTDVLLSTLSPHSKAIYKTCPQH